MESSIKKGRSPNFTPEEKELLVSIIANKYASILENKKTNQESVSTKLRAWKDIEKLFNSTSNTGIFRQWSSLKLFYENQKKELRRKLSKERIEIFKTGGGPSTTLPQFDNCDKVMLGIVNEKTTRGCDNPFDSDAEMITISYPVEPNEEINFEFSQDLHNQFKENAANIEKDATSVTLNTHAEDLHLSRPSTSVFKEIPSATSQSKRRPTQKIHNITSAKFAEKYDELMDRRLFLVNKQINMLEQEEKMKLEKHTIEIQSLKLDIELKKKKLM